MSKIRADLVLVERGLFDSRAKARAAIEAGGVRVAGQVLKKPSELIEPDAPIEAVAAEDAPKPKRTRRKKADDAEAVAVEAPAETEAAEKPKRTRKKKNPY